MSKKKKAAGSRSRILAFLLANVGRVVGKDKIRHASGNASEWARRLRELRDEVRLPNPVTQGQERT